MAPPTDPVWEYMKKEKEAKTPGGSPTVKCTLCHQVRVANASRQKGHLLHLPEGWAPCKGIPPPEKGKQHSAADLQLAAEALAEVQRRMQDVRDKWHATQEAASRKRQLETTVRTGQQEKQHQQKTLAEVYKRADKAEVDAALAQFLYSSGVPFHTVENPYFRAMLSVKHSPFQSIPIDSSRFQSIPVDPALKCNRGG